MVNIVAVLGCQTSQRMRVMSDVVPALQRAMLAAVAKRVVVAVNFLSEWTQVFR